MTAHPTRATVAGRAYLDLQNLARRQAGPPTSHTRSTRWRASSMATTTLAPAATAQMPDDTRSTSPPIRHHVDGDLLFATFAELTGRRFPHLVLLGPGRGCKASAGTGQRVCA